MPINLEVAKIRVKTTSRERGISLAHSYVNTCGICASKLHDHAFDKCSKECMLEMHVLCIFFGVWVSWEENGRKRTAKRKKHEKVSIVLLTLREEANPGWTWSPCPTTSPRLSKLQRLLCFHLRGPCVWMSVEELCMLVHTRNPAFGRGSQEYQEIRAILGYIAD